jgi:F-type H+-transporting ATPase subunit delta
MSETTPNHAFDAGRQSLGAVYAKALFGATEKTGETDTVLAALESLVGDVFNKLPKFEAALSSLLVSADDKERMLEGAFATRAPRVLVNALKVMAKHNRLNCVREVLQAFQHLVNESRGRVEVQLRTAAPVSNQLLEQIRQRLVGMLGREVVIKSTVQPEILGGIVVRVGDKLFDGSVVSKLEQLRTQSFDKTEGAIRASQERFVKA